MKRVLLYLRTIRHLRATQVLAQIRKRVLPVSASMSLVHDVRLRPHVQLGPCLSPPRLTNGDHSFRFLNQTKTFPIGSIDWDSREMPKLWRYNLHYFDYLFDAGKSHDAKVGLISDWIANNPPTKGTGWEPYTVSLRIVNWVKFFLKHDKEVQDPWLKSLYTQARWLERNLEHHILANHYLKNGVALFFAGVYFDGAEADTWLKRGWKILVSELAEQFLADVRHYERSPMYHSICVTYCLDVLNLTDGSSTAVNAYERTRIRETVTAGLNYLHRLCLPDGEIPLFNDSSFGIAANPGDIFSYAKRLMGYESPPMVNGLALSELPKS